MPAKGVDIAIWLLVLGGFLFTAVACYAFLDASDPTAKYKMRKLTSMMVCNCNDFVYRNPVDLLIHADDPKVLEAKEMEQMKSAQKQAEALGWEKVAEEDVIDDAIV